MSPNRSALVWLLPLLFGCASISTLQTASVVPAGKVRGAAGLGVLHFEEQGSTRDATALFQPELSLRYGLGGTFDLGLKAFLFGLELDLKKELYDNNGSVFSAALGLGYHNEVIDNASINGSSISYPSSDVVTIYLPLLYGVKFANNCEFVVGPRLADSIYTSRGEAKSSAVNVLWGGGAIAVAIGLGPELRIIPEVNVMYPLSASGPYATGGQNRSGSNGLWAIQAGLGILVGDWGLNPKLSAGH